MDFLAPIVAPAGAQQLARLHVRAFTISVEPATLRVGETLQLRITTRVDENILQLDNVTLPDLSGFESVGDERRCGTSGRGSVCVETMTLTPTGPGDRTIGPATLEAIDARNHDKPSRFATNVVRVRVTPVPEPNSLLFWFLKSFAVLASVAIVGYALLWGFRRRVPRPPDAVLPEKPPVKVTDPLPELLSSLAAEPTRPRVLAVRAELRRRAGAREDETLDALLLRGAAGGDPSLAGALRAIETPAFVDDRYVASEAQRALPILERLLGRTGASQ